MHKRESVKIWLHHTFELCDQNEWASQWNRAQSHFENENGSFESKLLNAPFRCDPFWRDIRRLSKNTTSGGPGKLPGLIVSLKAWNDIVDWKILAILTSYTPHTVNRDIAYTSSAELVQQKMRSNSIGLSGNVFFNWKLLQNQIIQSWVSIVAQPNWELLKLVFNNSALAPVQMSGWNPIRSYSVIQQFHFAQNQQLALAKGKRKAIIGMVSLDWSIIQMDFSSLNNKHTERSR